MKAIRKPVPKVSSADKQRIFWTVYLPRMDYYSKQRMFRAALDYLKLYARHP